MWLVKRSPLGWLGGLQEKQLFESMGEGATRAIAWRGPMLAWANNVGVRIFDVERMVGVAHILAPRDAPGWDVCPARIIWEHDASLLIAWGTRVTAVAIRERAVPSAVGSASASGGSGDVLLRRIGEPVVEFDVDAFVCGLAPFGDEQLALLTYSLEEVPAAMPDVTISTGGGGDDSDAAVAAVELTVAVDGGAPSAARSQTPAVAPTPATNVRASLELWIVSRDNIGAVLYRDVLPMRGFTGGGGGVNPNMTPAAFSLATDPDGLLGQEGLPLLFVVGPTDVIIAQPRSPGDHIDWLVESGRIGEAAGVLLTFPDVLPPARRRTIMDAYIESLMVARDFTKAAAACRRLLPRGEPSAWEAWLRAAFDRCDSADRMIFADLVVALSTAGDKASTSLALSQQAPLRLSEDAYELVISHYIATGDAARLLFAVTHLIGARPLETADALSMDVAQATGGLLPSTGSEQLDALLGKAAAKGKAGVKSASSLFGRLGGRTTTAAGRAVTDAHIDEDDPASLPRRAPHLAHVSSAAVQAMIPGGEILSPDEDAAAAAASTIRPLYDLQRVTSAVQSALRGFSKKDAAAAAAEVSPSTTPRGYLLQALVGLLELDGRIDDVVRVYVHERRTLLVSPQAAVMGDGAPSETSPVPAGARTPAAMRAHLFALLDAHKLISAVADRATALIEIDQPAALSLLGRHMSDGECPPESVADQLRGAPRSLLAYLHHLFTVHHDAYNTQAFTRLHAEQLDLYDTYDRSALLPFLRGSDFYPLETARQLCLRAAPAALHRELVYVLSRMGNVKDAIDLLVDRLRDVPGAVALAASFDDEDVWAEVVARTLRTRDGALIAQLLDAAPDTPLAAARIIADVPADVPIPHLAARLRVLLADRAVVKSMVAAGADLMRRDMVHLIARLVRGQRAGIAMPDDARCELCNEFAVVAARGSSVPTAGTAATATLSDDRSGDQLPNDGADDGDASGEVNDDVEHASARKPERGLGRAGSGVGGASATTSAVETPAIVHAAAFACGHAFHETCLAGYSGGGSASSSVPQRQRARSTDAARRSSFAAFGTNTVTGDARRARRSSSGGGVGGNEGDEPRQKRVPSRRCPLCNGGSAAVVTE